MMTSRELDALARIGTLKAEAPSRAEYDGLISLGEARITDARRKDLAPASRFDLAYNASHALALAALRRVGFRAGNRRVVFEALAHTTGRWGQVFTLRIGRRGQVLLLDARVTPSALLTAPRLQVFLRGRLPSRC
jgi:hypothetical protein